MSHTSHLLLQEQLCFPIYATSRLITRLYQPSLQLLDLTYPQYLVMLALWEKDQQNVGQLGKRLYLNTNTLTPLLKKMAGKGLLERNRSSEDERTVIIQLRPKGSELKLQAENIPIELAKSLKMPVEDLKQMRALMWKFLETFELDPMQETSL